MYVYVTGSFYEFIKHSSVLSKHSEILEQTENKVYCVIMF
jgi:hypothetical protein